MSFLIYLWQSVPPDEEVATLSETPTADPAATKNSSEQAMTWDFYEIFPKSEVPIVEDYTAPDIPEAAPDDRAWVLQAGSFRRQEDADTLRAELILMGMDVYIKTVKKDGQTWHRVMVGPMDTQLELTRSRNKLAENNIQSISLRVER